MAVICIEEVFFSQFFFGTEVFFFSSNRCVFYIFFHQIHVFSVNVCLTFEYVHIIAYILSGNLESKTKQFNKKPSMIKSISSRNK